MGKLDKGSKRNLTISLSEEEFQKLNVCAEYRGMTLNQVAEYYLRDWIDTDYPASQGRVSRRQIYRNYP